MAHGPAGIIDKHFEKVTDPRANRGGNHDLLEMIFMAITATVCGANGWADVERFVKGKSDWFQQYIAMERGVPSHDTFGRIFARLDTAEFLTAMRDWVDTFAGSLRDRGIAIDGKTLRGSYDQAAGRSALHTITAFSVGTRTCLRQMSVGEKTNEIPEVPVLLQLLELDGAIVTASAYSSRGVRIPAATAGTRRRDRDAGCHALPGGHGSGNSGSRRGLRADREGQPAQTSRVSGGEVHGLL